MLRRIFDRLRIVRRESAAVKLIASLTKCVPARSMIARGAGSDAALANAAEMVRSGLSSVPAPLVSCPFAAST